VTDPVGQPVQHACGPQVVLTTRPVAGQRHDEVLAGDKSFEDQSSPVGQDDSLEDGS